MIDIFINYFYAIAGGILSLSFGGYITWRIYSKKRFVDAADNFGNTILTELEGLYPTPIKWPKEPMMIVEILKEKFPRLEVAVTKFRGHLMWFKRSRFDRAWQEYHKDYFQYVPMQGESYSYGKLIEKHNTMNTYQDTFRNNVAALLKFAKQP